MVSQGIFLVVGLLSKAEEKNKHCLLTYIYMESRRMVLMNLFEPESRGIDVENGELVDVQGKERGTHG